MTVQATGSEFSVNAITTRDQDHPAIAISSFGQFAIVWQSQNQNGNSSDIYERLYRPDGGTLKAEFRVNRTAAGNQTNPSVAVDGAGNSVVVWSGDSQNGSGKNIYAQRLDSTGKLRGREILVNSSIVGEQTTPAVAMDLDGNFVVTWTSKGQPNSNTVGQDTSGTGVYAQRFTANGRSLGREFLVNRTTRSDQANPAIAMNSAGSYVIAWESKGQNGKGKSIYAQVYRANGTRIGSEFQVSDTAADDQEHPTVGIDAAGNFVIAWEGSDGDGLGIYAKRYSASGNPRGQTFRVNSTTSRNQITPSLGMSAAGEFTVTWASNGQGSSYDVYAQRYKVDGKASGSEFRVNQTRKNAQTNPAIGTALNGDFVVGWTTNAQGNNKNIDAQRYITAPEFPTNEIKGTKGNDRLFGTSGNDRIYSYAGDDTLKGGAGDDWLVGGDGNDELYGGSGNDTLNGGNGRDLLDGGSGNDVLIGGGDNDVLIGGDGRDIFVIGQASGRDTIRDFKSNTDHLGLAEGLKFSDLLVTQSGLNTWVSVGSNIIAILEGVKANTITASDFVRA